MIVKADEPEEPPESEKQEENAEEGKPFVDAEPEEEEVEPPPLISTEDTGDLLVSCMYMYIMFHFKLFSYL